MPVILLVKVVYRLATVLEKKCEKALVEMSLLCVLPLLHLPENAARQFLTPSVIITTFHFHINLPVGNLTSKNELWCWKDCVHNVEVSEQKVGGKKYEVCCPNFNIEIGKLVRQIESEKSRKGDSEDRRTKSGLTHGDFCLDLLLWAMLPLPSHHQLGHRFLCANTHLYLCLVPI